VSTVLDLHAPVRDVPPLLARLVDDAGLFPPTAAPMAAALAGHLAAQQTRYAGVIGFFLCPISRLGELVTRLRSAPPQEPVPVSLVVDTGLGGVPKAINTAMDNPNLITVRMIEVRASSDVDATWLVQLTEFVPDDVVRVVEPRRGHPDWLDGVRLVAEAGCWPRLRCGGKASEAFPSVPEVAAFLTVATEVGRPFKATAGLHHAVRRREQATGLIHHGLLNMLVATARAVAGGDVPDALASTDGVALATEAGKLDERGAHAVRDVFACYGSPSLTGPVADLERLDLL